jgi:DNA polymerase-3 subunit gamma/tau
MFENIIEQGAVLRLRDDITGGRFAPSVLFFGPPETGKGSAALELARALSCENDARWKCACSSCEKHRYLQHEDLLLMGRRSFIAEIYAGRDAFLRNPSSQGAKMLFFRSIRKLQARFSPVLTEDDPKAGKLVSNLQSLDEGLNELLADNANMEKLCASIVKEAVTLNDEGIGSFIPVSHVRRASYWCRLAPSGKRKTLVIENADNMRDEARNSLLKLLEEPPAAVNIVLTAQRREALISTILSRVRPYRFLKRGGEGEKEVLRRVFQYVPGEKLRETGGSLISAYLDSFLPQSGEKLYPLAAWFIVSLARIAAISAKRKEGSIPRFILALGERYAQIAEASGLSRIEKSRDLVKMLLVKSGNFEDDSFSRFLKLCLDLIADAAREINDTGCIVYCDIFKKHVSGAVTAVDVLNQSTALALEALVYGLKNGMGTAW